ncbi:S8 family peptidase [Novosphingobium sp. 9U]|uniref:S8 family peptidase n=1 Tax=Novosphingobium sp. 9U TaxID=2653158 RepID=UPI0012F295B5|nr:S8 family peptidase [Novosphingobium sp. 9U]VWX55111.1 Peptidase S8 [Novosphingobium sp. 9U]
MAVRSDEDDEEYRRNYDAFEYVHALYALDHGWTGQGVLVGLVDDGVLQNAELTGQLSALSKDFGTTTTGSSTTDRNVIGDKYSDHGTMVAGVIAGLNDDSGIQGMAPGAKIVALRVSDVNTTTNEETLGRTLPAALNYAAANGIKVVNASLAKVDASQASPVWSNMVTRYAASGGLFVNSAGNESEANAKGYLDLNDANRNGWLFVTALDVTETGVTLADYSNQCGSIAMARCVSAMGSNATMDVRGELVLFSGTSSAAGQVSGLAALILSKWPQLSGVEAGQVILNTAHDLGAAGIDPVYGAGLIDVEAALSPVSPTLSNGVTQTSLQGASMVIPDALGGGAATTTAVKSMLGKVTLLDGFGRDFSGSLAGLVAHPERREGSFARQVAAGAGAGSSSFAAPGFTARFGYETLGDGANAQVQRGRMTSGEFALALGSTRVMATYAGQDAIQDEAMGLAPASDVTLAYAPGANLSVGVARSVAGGQLSVSALSSDGDYGSASGLMLGWSGKPLRVKMGYLTEHDTLFGTPVGAGALRFGNGARTAFLELSRQWHAGEWSLDTYASVGATRLKIGGDTLLTSARPILSQRAGLSASHAAFGGRVRMGLALPLVAFAGSGELTYAIGYDLTSRSLVYSRQRVGLTGRIDPVMSVGYERGGAASAFRLAAATNASGGDWRALASWRLTLK